MKLTIVGVGNAGSRIVNRILDVEADTGRDFSRGNVLTFNTTRTEFTATERVPEDRRVVIGDTHRDLDGEGTDGDAELAAEVARDEVNEIRRSFDPIEFCSADATLVVAGLGGGTGGGAGAVVLEELQAMYEKPVYALGVLPAGDEGTRTALNAARSLQSFVENADNVIASDNEAWTGDGTDAEDYDGVNRELATRVVTLFAAGEFGQGTVAEHKLDPSDIMRTLDTGGVSSIGYASTEVPARGGLRSWLRRLPWVSDPGSDDGDEDDDATDAAKINQLVRKAVRSQLTMPCEVSSAERALIVLSGPSAELSRKGFESGRYWLEQEADTVEVLAGDEPRDRSTTLAAAVLLSNVTEVPRIKAMQAQAVDAPDGVAERAAAGDAESD